MQVQTNFKFAVNVGMKLIEHGEKELAKQLFDAIGTSIGGDMPNTNNDTFVDVTHHATRHGHHLGGRATQLVQQCHRVCAEHGVTPHTRETDNGETFFMFPTNIVDIVFESNGLAVRH